MPKWTFSLSKFAKFMVKVEHLSKLCRHFYCVTVRYTYINLREYVCVWVCSLDKCIMGLLCGWNRSTILWLNSGDTHTHTQCDIWIPLNGQRNMSFIYHLSFVKFKTHSWFAVFVVFNVIVFLFYSSCCLFFLRPKLVNTSSFLVWAFISFLMRQPSSKCEQKYGYCYYHYSLVCNCNYQT